MKFNNGIKHGSLNLGDALFCYGDDCWNIFNFLSYIIMAHTVRIALCILSSHIIFPWQQKKEKNMTTLSAPLRKYKLTDHLNIKDDQNI